MNRFTRRSFIRRSTTIAAGVAAAAAFRASSWAKVNGANDDIRVAVAGLGGRGRTNDCSPGIVVLDGKSVLAQQMACVSRRKIPR